MRHLDLLESEVWFVFQHFAEELIVIQEVNGGAIGFQTGE